MNFATSTQLKHWRFTRQELAARRAAARREFFRTLEEAGTPTNATPRTEKEDPAGTAAGTASGVGERAKKVQAQLGALPLSVDEEVVVLRSWMTHIDSKLQQAEAGLHTSPFVRATTWSFMRRFYVGNSMLEYPVEAILACALLLAIKVEEEEDVETPGRICNLIAKFDKRPEKLTVLLRRREMVECELALVLALEGAMVCYHPLSYLAPICTEFQLWFGKWLKTQPSETQQRLPPATIQTMFRAIYRLAERFVSDTQWTDCELLHPSPVIAAAAVQHGALHEFGKAVPKQASSLVDSFFQAKGIGQLDFATLVKRMRDVNHMHTQGGKFLESVDLIKGARKNLKKAMKKIRKFRTAQQQVAGPIKREAEDALEATSKRPAVEADARPPVGAS
eukprot:INCI11320.2.p1 GENE.INCI11320.2~~INCI11320.2.p1  ORF type:complete len:393 (+),score=71.97 INCI11320.2:125-1303(+)